VPTAGRCRPSPQTAARFKATGASLAADLRLTRTKPLAVCAQVRLLPWDWPLCLSGRGGMGAASRSLPHRGHTTPKPYLAKAGLAQPLAHLPAHLMGFWIGTRMQLATAEHSDRTDERRRFNASVTRIQLSSSRAWAPPTAGVGLGSSSSPLQGAPVIKPSLSGTLTWQAATVLFHRIIFSGWRITSW